MRSGPLRDLVNDGSRPVQLGRQLLLGATAVGVIAIYMLHVAFDYAAIGPYIVDDAFIYFRYAHNLATGHGLVYNPGEAVEGYTGFTWAMALAAADWLGLPLILFAQCAGVLLGACTLWLTWRVARQLIGPGLISLLPVLFLSTNRTFCMWSVEGLETSLFGALLMATYCIWLAEVSRPHEPRFPLLGLAAAMLALTRPEGFLFAGVAALLYAADTRRTGRTRAFVLNSLAFLALILSHLLFRIAYYGDVLPNTAYAKITGFQPGLGLAYTSALAAENHLLRYMPIALLGAVYLAKAPEFRLPRRWMLAAVIVYAGYVISIGGDYFEFRFLDPVLPIWALWTVAGTASISAHISRPPVARLALLALTLLWLSANVQSVLQPPEASLARTTPEAEAQYTRKFVAAGRWLALNLQPRDVIAIRPAGAIAYLSGARCLDILGLNDRAIAHGASGMIAPDQSIGHQRLVSRDYLVRRGVTYFIGHPQISPFPARPGRGFISAEIEPGRFLIMDRLDPGSHLEDRIYLLSEHRGSLQGWAPAR